MLWQFTLDNLEKEFGKLCQWSGETYFITVQKELGKVYITKAKLLLQMKCSTELVSCHTCDKCGYLMDEKTANIVDNLPDLEKNIPYDVHMSLVYVAGHVVKSDEKIDDFSFMYYNMVVICKK